MAGRFYEDDDENDNVHRLKPMQHIVGSHSTTSLASAPTSIYSQARTTGSPPQQQDLRILHLEDATLKRRIRALRLISRVAGVLLSIATLIPLILTLTKFVQTREQVFVVAGRERTAWARGTRSWFAWMYAGVAGVSLLLNSMVVAAYVKGVRQANRAAAVSATWTYVVVGVHIIVWGVGVGVYRYGKEPVQGREVDLWGWTCSDTARSLQNVLTNVNFERYCGIQTASFYIGVANVVVGLLTVVILILAQMRKTSKNRLHKAKAYRRVGEDVEPLRSS